MKKFLIVLVLILMAAGGYYAWKKKSGAASTAKTYTYSKVEKNDIRRTVDSTGIVTANRDVEIKAKASGTIVKIPYDVSDQVKKGELLVELDPVDELRAVKRAEISTSSSLAQLAQSKVELDVAQRTLKTDRERADSNLKAATATLKDRQQKAKRTRELLAKQLASQQEVDEASANAASALAEETSARIKILELDTQEADLESRRQAVIQAQTTYENTTISLLDARQRLRETKIYAPIDGVISALNVQEGQIISSAISNVGGGTAMMVVSDLSRIFVLASVDESDIGQIGEGQQVRITADAYGEELFLGKVDRVAIKGASTSNVVTFEVKIEVTSDNKAKLKPQMTTNVGVVLEEKTSALTVSSDAVLKEKGESFVEVKSAGATPEKRKIETGITDGLLTEVKSGLKEGEEVAAQGTVASKWQATGTAATTKRTGMGPPPP